MPQDDTPGPGRARKPSARTRKPAARSTKTSSAKARSPKADGVKQKPPVRSLRQAAFFDLDRTLIRDSSALLLVEALIEKGLVSDRERLVADVSRLFYRVAGETWLGMQVTRRGISRFAGWPVADVQDAAKQSLRVLDESIWSEAREIVADHRERGHLVVIATSTGREIVQPLAEHLGVDHLIASEYEVEDGKFTGRLVGPWIWGPDKADAVVAYARENGVDISNSYAYSDSYYDRHLLELAGYPRVVNPDPLLRGLAARKGWPVLQFRNAESGPASGIEIYDLVIPLSHPLVSPVNVAVEGLDNIPRTGPVIVAANHRSYLDPVVLTAVGGRRGRKLRYLGKKEVFDVPVVGDLMKAIGQIRVDRGSGSDEPLNQALDALSRGEAIGIFPQGTIPRGAEFFEPKLRGRTGVARLAAATGVPVVPVALWGTEAVWPRSSRIPKVVDVARRRAVHARVGEPIVFDVPESKRTNKNEVQRITDEVMEAISALLPEDVRTPPPPTDEQIRLATPSGGQTPPAGDGA